MTSLIKSVNYDVSYQITPRICVPFLGDGNITRLTLTLIQVMTRHLYIYTAVNTVLLYWIIGLIHRPLGNPILAHHRYLSSVLYCSV